MYYHLAIAAFIVPLLTTSNAENTQSSSKGFSSDKKVLLPFPPQFYVTTGTTIPLSEEQIALGEEEGVVDPIAHSGAVYYDALYGRARIDHFWLGHQRTFIVLLEQGIGYVYENDAYAGGRGGSSDRCTVLQLTGRLLPFGVPAGAVREDHGGKPGSKAAQPPIRNVPTLHYSFAERDDHLQQVDMFVRAMRYDRLHFNVSRYPSNSEEEQDIKEKEGEQEDYYYIPWRIQTRRLRERKEIAPPPVVDVPNWRYFGGPMLDEVDEYLSPDGTSASKALERFIANIPAITIDFYNFVPMQPDPNVFVPPSSCVRSHEEFWRQQKQRQEQGEDSNSDAFSSDADLDIRHVQRLLLDLSFNTLQGRKVVVASVSKATAPRHATYHEHSIPSDDKKNSDL